MAVVIALLWFNPETSNNMARQLRWALAVVIAFGAIGSGAATGQSHPQTRPVTPPEVRRDDRGGRWIWWKDKHAVAELAITPEQSAAIDRIFKESIDKSKPLREEVMRLEKALSLTIKANTADVSIVEQQVDTVETKRAELNKIRVVMLYRMHKVLSLEQNAKFQAMVDRWEASHKKHDGERRK